MEDTTIFLLLNYLNTSQPNQLKRRIFFLELPSKSVNWVKWSPRSFDHAEDIPIHCKTKNHRLQKCHKT